VVELSSPARVAGISPSENETESVRKEMERRSAAGDDRGREDRSSEEEPPVRNKGSSAVRRSIEFNFNRDLDVLQAQVVDLNSDKVIRVVPPEAQLRFQKRFRDMVQERMAQRDDAAQPDGGQLDTEA
jgi:uncharacterized FlaG/YvyC family protein